MEVNWMKKVTIGFDHTPQPRVHFGIEYLKNTLEDFGFFVEESNTEWSIEQYRNVNSWKIYIGNRNQSEFIKQLEKEEILLYNTYSPTGEGFYLASLPGRLLVISSESDSGALYGCQELAHLIRKKGEIPNNLGFGEGPDMVLRGPALGLQKTTWEPPRQTYEYPITPDRFPWFYDKDLWLDWLNRLFENRSNILYLWSGHPFSSLVKLQDYPEALEVTEEEYLMNTSLFRWLTEEADKRGIWVVVKFYNIHIPLPFAEKHNLKLHQPKPLPLTSDYYRKSIAEFVRSYPNVGLMVCLGEALQGHLYGIEWFTETILPGVLDGIQTINNKELPPIILRAHAIQPEKVIEKALPLYPNLYTMAKYNGESLTTWTPRGDWQKIHQNLSALKTVHIINVHILANLEPFRYGSPSFIHKSMKAGKYRLGANGLHLYPLFYWDWPYSPDQTTPRLRQMDRDWLWFDAWARYAWKTDLHPETEQLYWVEKLGEHFGNDKAGNFILEGLDASGECAPKIIRRIGITEGNRQTMSLGMTMSQLTNPERHRPWKDLWESHSPEGERLPEYILREIQDEAHIGETPIDMIEEVERDADRAVEAIEKAKPYVTKNKEEFEQIENDMNAIRAMVYSYTNKVRAAIQVLLYKHAPKNSLLEKVEILEEGVPYLKQSLDWYKKLTAITEKSYLFANSMQTPQRKVPLPDGGRYDHWRDCLPIYEKEFQNFILNVEMLKNGEIPMEEHIIEHFREVPFTVHSENVETYKIEKPAKVFTDVDLPLMNFAEELTGLTALRFSQALANETDVNIDIEFSGTSYVLVGYFNSSDEQWLQPPNLEIDTHADYRGGVMPILRKGIEVFAYPSVNVHAYRYETGRHLLSFGKGSYLILGIISAAQDLPDREVEYSNSSAGTLDWLYESPKEIVTTD
jgi:hypothetical protein